MLSSSMLRNMSASWFSKNSFFCIRITFFTASLER